MSGDGHVVAANQQGPRLDDEVEDEGKVATDTVETGVERAVETAVETATASTEVAATTSVEPTVGGPPFTPTVDQPVAPPPPGVPPPPPEPVVSDTALDPRPRHISPGRGRRASRRGRRVRQRFWSIDPWSVFKVSSLFLLCVTLIVLVAGILLWNVGRRTGTIDQAESFVTRLGAYGSCVDETTVKAGMPFERDEDCGTGRVLVEGFQLDDRALLKAFMIGGGIVVLAGSLASVLVALLINLLNEITGGVRYTVVTEPVLRPRARSTAPPARL